MTFLGSNLYTLSIIRYLFL